MTDLEFTEEARGGDFFSKDGKDKGTWTVGGNPRDRFVELTLLYVDGVNISSNGINFTFYPSGSTTINFRGTVEIGLAPIVIAKAIEFFGAWHAKYPNAIKNVD